MTFPSSAYTGVDIRTMTVPFITTAAAQDKNVHLMHVPMNMHILNARLVFTALDTFASGVDIDIETDNGTTETVIATYDTVAGTAVDTVYDMGAVASLAVAAGLRLQLHINDDEDAACEGVLELRYLFI